MRGIENDQFTGFENGEDVHANRIHVRYKNKKSPYGDIWGEKWVRQIWGAALVRIPSGRFQGMIR
jgi:hypothetical protein